MKEIVPKRDLWSRYGTKSAAVGCKQAANDDERCQSFGLVFFQHLHKLFGDIDAITYLKPPDFTNRQILTLICGYGKETSLQIGRCTCITYMRQLHKCSHVIIAAFLDHDKVQKTDLKPLQLVKSEWSPPLQQLPVPSVSTKFLQFDVQFSTSVVNKPWTYFFIVPSHENVLIFPVKQLS